MSTPFNRLNPFPAKIKDRYVLTKPGSTKETHHVVLDITGSGLQFKVGDSVGIYADNDPLLIDELLSQLQVSPETPVTHPRTGETLTLKTFLTKKVNLSRLPSDLRFDNLIEHFAPLLPRFYSVASSPLLHPNEIHLTVTVSTYDHSGEIRYGVASHFLCHLSQIDATPIPCYIQPAPHFTLPPSDHIPIIMVGPGTGVAPFRGFLQERIHRTASGKNWLFFGERHRAHDFFYEDFFQSLVSKEQLILDTAFSRDQEEKLYVQHKLLEKGAEIWAWLEQGSHFYVCGDADPMAKDVENTLLHIIETHGNVDAKSYFKKLRQEKRYLTDVY